MYGYKVSALKGFAPGVIHVKSRGGEGTMRQEGKVLYIWKHLHNGLCCYLVKSGVCF